MLTPYLPYPPSDGGQVRSYNLIKQLAKHHDITLVSFTREHNTTDQVKHMEKYCKKVLVFRRGRAWTLSNIIRTGFSPYPFLVSIYYSPEVKRQLAKEIEVGNYDLIHAETFYAMSYLPDNNLPTVLVEQTVMSRVFSHYVETNPNWLVRPLFWIDVAKIKFWERYYWRKADKLVAVSEEDAQIMKKGTKDLDVRIVPNGVGEDFENLPKTLHYNHRILYMGNYKWMQNWEAAQVLATEVFPLVKKEISDSRLIITGQFMTQQVKNLGSKEMGIDIVELEDRDSKGVVNSYRNAGLLVAPIYGPGGTRLKILAAMASMVPVVTTPLGAEGYGANNNESILVGSTPKEIAQQVCRVMTDRDLYQRIAVNARKLVENKFTWAPIAKNLESIYKEALYDKKT